MSAIREETFKIIDVMKLPQKVSEDLMEYCPGNDLAIQMSFEDAEGPLADWLKENNLPFEDTYWVYYSW